MIIDKKSCEITLNWILHLTQVPKSLINTINSMIHEAYLNDILTTVFTQVHSEKPVQMQISLDQCKR